jgi:hypothetical protein
MIKNKSVWPQNGEASEKNLKIIICEIGVMSGF